MADRFPLETRRHFVTAIGEMARSRTIWVLATLRSEFYGRCEEIPDLVALKGGVGQYQLLPPTKSELSQIIRLPLSRPVLSLRWKRKPGQVWMTRFSMQRDAIPAPYL